MIPKLKYLEERRPKTNISASDADKLGIDIILGLNGVPYSNPMEWTAYLKMSAGKAIELQTLKVLKQNGIVDEDYDQDFEMVSEKIPEGELGEGNTRWVKKERESTKIVREGITISMRFDAEVKKGGAKMYADDSLLPQGFELEMKEGEPIEIKSINNKNAFDIQRYIDNKPKENYVKQLAIYMDALNKDQGHLFVASVDGLHTFWFVCKKTGEGIYQCGDTIVDLNKEYKRFAQIYADSKNIWNYPNMKKYWEEELYKLPLDKIDWTKVSTSKIGEARNGRFVIGTENKWKVDYSPYKDIIIKIQNETLGYTPDQIEQIKTLTAGYTAKAKVAKQTAADNTPPAGTVLTA
jgi:hypothetical protein